MILGLVKNPQIQITMLYWQAVGIENVNQSLRSASLIQNGAQATISSNRHILSKRVLIDLF